MASRSHYEYHYYQGPHRVNLSLAKLSALMHHSSNSWQEAEVEQLIRRRRLRRRCQLSSQRSQLEGQGYFGVESEPVKEEEDWLPLLWWLRGHSS